MSIFKNKSDNHRLFKSTNSEVKLNTNSYSNNDEFIPIPVKLYNGSGFSNFVYNLVTGKTHKLDKSLTYMMQFFTESGTINDFINKIEKMKWEGTTELIRSNINDLISCGLLYSKNKLIANIIKNNTSSKHLPKIKTTGWITKNRILKLQQSIESLIKNNLQFDRHPRYIICDDSQKVQIQSATKAMLGSIKAKSNMQFFYCGEIEKRDFCKKLKKIGKTQSLPEHVLDFALFDTEHCGSNFGANRNALLLATAGEMIMCTDDDIICNTANLSKKNPELRIESISRHDEILTFADRESLFNDVTINNNDLLALHEELLGRDLTELITKHAGEKNNILIGNTSQRLLRMLVKSTGRVKTTNGGTCGDLGNSSPRYIYNIQGADLDRILSSKSAYNTALTSREVFLSHNWNTLAEGIFYAGMNIGLDNRSILPPFFPVFRGEDTLFSNILRVYDSNALMGYLPQAIIHIPDKIRNYPPGAEHKCSLSTIELICLLLGGYSSSPAINNSAYELNALGVYFKKIGSLSDYDYKDFIKQLWLTRTSIIIGKLEKTLHEDRNRKNAHFRSDDIERYLEELCKQSLGTDICIPDDSPMHGKDAVSFFKKLIYKYGELLIWWPVIYEAALQAKNQGEEIFAEIV